METLRACADEVGNAVQSGRHRGLSGRRDSQYHLDVVADEVALRVLLGAGLRVVSEESGTTGYGDITVVVDPIDGSTNCDHGVPFYATSLAAVANGEVIAAVVKNQATGTVFAAESGSGAWRDNQAVKHSGRTQLSQAIVSFSGLPDRHLGWSQFRSLGAASLEICLVADGSIDAFTVAGSSVLSPWDYLGGLLISMEAGAVVSEMDGFPLVVLDRSVRRPLICATHELLVALQSVSPEVFQSQAGTEMHTEIRN